MPKDFAQSVAARIRCLREARALSVRELARRSGLPPESVSRSERGITEITLTNLAKLCQGLSIDLPHFFDFASKPDLTELKPEMRRVMMVLGEVPSTRLARVAKGLELILSEPKLDRSLNGRNRLRSRAEEEA